MSDGPQMDQGALAFQRGIGQGPQVNDEIKPNEDETPSLIVAGFEKYYTTGVKALQTIPLIGEFLARIIPMNPGKASIAAGLEYEGKGGAQIRPGSGGPQGGFLAKIAGELVKNSAITDQTAGVGGSASGSSGGGEGGGTGAGEGGGARFFDNIDAPIISAAAGGQHFEAMDVPRSMLGTFSSPIIGDMGTAGRGEGFNLSA